MLGAGPSSALLPASAEEVRATVALNVRLRDLNVDAARQDERRIEVIANGLALWGGAQLAVDTTLVSPVTSAGAPRRSALPALHPLSRAKPRSAPTQSSDSLRDASLSSSLSSSVAAGALKLPPLSDFSRASARAPPRLPPAVPVSAFAARWSALLSFAAARAFAASLLSLPLGGTTNVDGEPPLLSDILAESSFEPPLASRMA